MRILYYSCHSIQEHDDIRMFHELGHEVFSLAGAYMDLSTPAGDGMRPKLPGDYVTNEDDLKAANELMATQPGRDPKEFATKEFIERFDVVYVAHVPHWFKNWDNMRVRPVIWRTIGQSVSHVESFMSKFREDGLKIVRYSPMEENIPGYIGGDTRIRFQKWPEDHGPWNGEDKHVVTINQALPERSVPCNYETWKQVTDSLPRKLFGPHNEAAGRGCMGKVTSEELHQALRDARAYFYVGTYPASYTLNFIEAWMTGTPIVAIGPRRGNPTTYHPGHHLYEIDSLIQPGVNGYWSDDIEEMRSFLQRLLDDDALAAEISARGRESAIATFGVDGIREQWREFLDALA